MRAPSGCTMQQSLTPEAAIVVKQAINLARRRGHTQVTPIHVATIMLHSNSQPSLLQRACFKSHSHPLQFSALEVCFSVALNRLPTAPPGPILGPHRPHHPSLSNALVAAFKRAQAHQRRDSAEAQQQPLLCVKIEAEQLVVSILDDPSVSRVMREAGFSSSHVKTNVGKQALPLTTMAHTSTPTTPVITKYLSSENCIRSEDVLGVVLSMVGKSTVVVSEGLGACESLVRAVKERIERGDVPNELKYAQILNLSMFSIKGFSREEVELKLGELKCVLKGCVGRGVVLYLGDLRWVSEYWACYGGQRSSFYCPIEHMVMGIRRLFYGNSVENGRFRALGIASFSSYIKCKAGNPSLETLLDLHPLAIPVGSLDLSLKLDCTRQGESKGNVSGDNYSWSLQENRPDMHLTCCCDCSASFRREVKSLAISFRNMDPSIATASGQSSLPSWLQKCKEEISEESRLDHQKDQGEIKELCKKWNSICSSIHSTTNLSSASPSPCTSISSYDRKSHQNSRNDTKLSLSTMVESKWFSKDHKVLMPDQNAPSRPDLLSNPNSTPNSTSSSETTEVVDKATKLNFEAMCCALEKRVPWQKEIIPDIASAVLNCRAGLVARIAKDKVQEKHETWLFFSGADKDGKIKAAKELAKLVFGSHKSFKSISQSSFSSPTRADSTDDPTNRRTRDQYDHGLLENFAKSLRDDPHRVFYIEDIEQVDQSSQKGLKRAIESGTITLVNGEMVPLEDAIVIFSCENLSSTSRACSPTKQKLYRDYGDDDQVAMKCEDEDDTEEASNSCPPLDLNLAVDDDAELGIVSYVDKQIFFNIQVL